jgi:hypothetical protein
LLIRHYFIDTLSLLPLLIIYCHYWLRWYCCWCHYWLMPTLLPPPAPRH